MRSGHSVRRVLVVALGLAAGVPGPARGQSSSDIADLLPKELTACAGPTATGDIDVERRSLYVPAQDGVRLAVDVFLPKPLAPGSRLPTLYAATRYWRGRQGAPPTAGEKLWIARGFAVVNADVRGTGASFGQWYIPYSPQEVKDVGYLANWIATQPWSNGKVVMTGTSYPGTTPLMGLADGQPAIKAIAPKFADFDIYADLLWPGGVPSVALDTLWGQLVRGLDLNVAPAGMQGSVRPVDGPDGESQLAAAVEAHKTNPWSFDKAYEATYRDEPRPRFGGMAVDAAAVYRLQRAAERSGAPIFGWGSWLDSGVGQGLLNRFTNWSNPQLTIIGPWTHGAAADVNVFQRDEPLMPARDAQERMVYCFLKNYVSDRPAPLPHHTLVYFTMGENKWKTSTVWPIAGTRMTRYYFASDHALSSDAPTATGEDAYTVDFDATAGPANRWATQAGGPRIDYGDRASADARLLVYTSAPLAKDMEITGQSIATLRVTSTATDGGFFVYVEDVAPDGRVTYLTEGQFRALHRKISSATPPYRTTYPYHTFLRADGAPLVPGQAVTLQFPLMPTSVRLSAGHRIRVAIAGADRETFPRIPATGPVAITVAHGGADGSFVDLPVIPGTP
jgi:putative CocE/NonD family hydrolase